MERFTKNKVFVAFIYILLGLLILYMLVLIRPLISGVYSFLKAVLAPFLIAMIISYVLNPVVRLLNQRKVPRTIAVLLIYAVFVSSAAVVLMNVVPMMMKQLNELNEHLPEISMRAQNLAEGINDNKFVPESVRAGINKALAKIESQVSTTISNFINGIGSTINMIFIAFIIPFLSFYMLKDFQLIERTALTIVPKKHRRSIIKLLVDIDSALGNYVRGQFIVCLIVGVLAYVGYWMIGMEYALLLGGIVAVFNIVPYLGPYIGAAPAIVMASTISMKMVVLVIAVNTACQILEGNIISPQVTGRTLNMHPLVIIFALLVGGELAGVVGLILAVPFFAVMKVIIQHLLMYYVQRRTV